MKAAQMLFTSVAYGIDLRVLGFDGRVWLSGEDLANVLEYRATGSITAVFSRHRLALKPHSAKARIDGKGHAVRLFDEAGVRYLCEYSKRPGAFHLLRWLDAGGMQAKADTVTDPVPIAANVLAFKAPDNTPPVAIGVLKKFYCRDLLKTLLRYSQEQEVEDLTHIIEAEIADLLSRRHCPGLNDARYELYHRYWLQGGAV